jgi:uncharacterized protein
VGVTSVDECHSFVVAIQLPEGRSLLINLISGALDVVDRETSRFVKEGSGTVSPDVRAQLWARGYSQDATVPLWRELAKKQKEPTIVVCMTLECPLNCYYCFQNDSRRKGARALLTLNESRFNACLRAIGRLTTDHQVEEVVITGGEPLQAGLESFIYRMLSYFHAHGVSAAIVTSGIGTKECWAGLSKHKHALRRIQVTLDGPKPVHNARRCSSAGYGTYDDAVYTVHRALEADVNVTLRVNIDRGNIDTLENTLGLLSRCGWWPHRKVKVSIARIQYRQHPSKLQVSESELLLKCVELGLFPDNTGCIEYAGAFKVLGPLAELVEWTVAPSGAAPQFHPQGYYCEAAAGSSFLLGPDGLVYGCGELIGTPEAAVGRYAPRLTLFEREARPATDVAECVNCEILPLCAGGCPLVARVRHNDWRKAGCEGQDKWALEYIRARGQRLAEVLEGCSV